MLSLIFRGSNVSRALGPLAWIECRGGNLLLPDSVQPVAEYRRGSWVYGSMRFAQLECRSMLCVRFQNRAGREAPLIGPRTFVALRGPYVFAGRELIAKLDLATQMWIQTDTSGEWSVLRIEPISQTAIRRPLTRQGLVADR